MKYSQYNIILPDMPNKNVLYNTSSDKVIVINDDISNLLSKYKDQIDDLKTVHPSLYQSMLDNDFIVDSDKDEYQSIISSIEQDSNSPKSIHLTINPTMDCNFRCWYCYEEHNQGSKMSPTVLDNTKKLISNILQKDGVEKLVLAFFGGEPLLYFNSVIKPLIEFAVKCSNDLNKQVDIYFTTNGYLLSQSIITDLLSYDKLVHLQIPFDGDRENHNKTKFLKNKVGTYDKVIENTKLAIKSGLDVTVRCNYTAENISSFTAFDSEFQDVSHLNNFVFAFHKIWQEKQTEELQLSFETAQKTLSAKYNTEHNLGSKGLCYADFRHNMVINYNGNVYKCTARTFNDQNKLGTLESDGSVSWLEVANQRLKCKYNSAACVQCVLFPICMQGCSQNVFESPNADNCVFQRSEDDINQIVEARICKLTEKTI